MTLKTRTQKVLFVVTGCTVAEVLEEGRRLKNSVHVWMSLRYQQFGKVSLKTFRNHHRLT